MKRFNTTGLCNPKKHYMVDISERLREIKAMVDAGDYFCITRARQYGKTTTLTALAALLSSQYVVLSLDFQEIDVKAFNSVSDFSQGLVRLLLDASEFKGVHIPDEIAVEFEAIINKGIGQVRMDEVFRILKRWCRASDKGIVLMVDEVDAASDNQVFLNFLSQLRLQYLEKEKSDDYPAFQSVILAGVTDVRHLRAKIRSDEDHKVNSPWNIAADFNIDMSLSEPGIKGMLDEYEADHHTGMDTAAMAKRLRKYTSGYPYLVSRLCQLIDGSVANVMKSNEVQTGQAQIIGGSVANAMEADEVWTEKKTQQIDGRVEGQTGLAKAWTEQGLDEAIKIVLSDGKDTLFGSLMSKLANMPQLKAQLRGILMRGDVIPWMPYDDEQSLLWMYGFIKRKDNNTVAVANRIFEMFLYHYFLGESTRNEAFRSDAVTYKSIFINEDHSLNMPLILEHFVKTEQRVHGDADDRFLEEEGRERFLTYIAPIINGTGTYSIEEQTRDRSRMDVVIHYLGKRYVVELKIWRGPRYNADGEKQIAEYLDYFGLNTGYMVSFSFNKNKTCGVKRVNIGDKVLFEATV